jgi:type III secretion protein J
MTLPFLHSTPAILALGVLGMSCSVDVAHELEELEANRVIVALGDHGVAASKVPDQSHEGRFRVSIPEADLPVAVAALQHEGLPASRAPGVLDSLGESGLVPSRKTEHARWVAGTAGELERSLQGVAGVLSARVHLAVAEPDPLAGSEASPSATASVLIRHQAASPPLSANDVQRLVSGAVPGLEQAAVAVVYLAVASPADGSRPGLAQFGPLSVSHSSLTALRVLVGVVALVNVALLAALLLLWTRARRSEHREPTTPRTDSTG